MTITPTKWAELLNQAAVFWPATRFDQGAAEVWAAFWTLHRPQDSAADVMRLMLGAAADKTFGNTLKPADLLGLLDRAVEASMPTTAEAFAALERSMRNAAGAAQCLTVAHPAVARAVAECGGIEVLNKDWQYARRNFERAYEAARAAWVAGDRRVPAVDFWFELPDGTQGGAIFDPKELRVPRELPGRVLPHLQWLELREAERAVERAAVAAGAAKELTP